MPSNQITVNINVESELHNALRKTFEEVCKLTGVRVSSVDVMWVRSVDPKSDSIFSLKVTTET